MGLAKNPHTFLHVGLIKIILDEPNFSTPPINIMINTHPRIYTRPAWYIQIRKCYLHPIIGYTIRKICIGGFDVHFFVRLDLDLNSNEIQRCEYTHKFLTVVIEMISL
jgi:hypothetical protein